MYPLIIYPLAPSVHHPLQTLVLLPVVVHFPRLQPSSQHSSRVWLEVEPPDGSTSDLARHLEVVVPPEVGEGLLGFQILDTIKNLLLGWVGISFKIPTSLKWNG